MASGPARLLAIVLVMAGAVTWVTAAQTRAPVPAQQPVFKATTNYVVVDVVATDREGRLIADLTKDDFEIREQGRIQTITDFDLVVVPVSTQPIDLNAPQDPPPDVYTNATPPRDARAFVFLIDGRIKPEFLVPTKRVLIAFLEALAPDDEAAMVYMNRSDTSQDFTRDRGSLVRSANRLRDAAGGFQDQWPLGRSLKYVINTISAARESRRVLVYVGPAAAIDVDAARENSEIYEAMTLAQQLNVPIYTLDPRGLQAPDLGLGGHMEDQTPAARAALDAAKLAEEQGGRTLADRTGGRAFVNSWDVRQAARELMTDNGTYYLLGFYPTPSVEDGKFHPVDVIVKRPGVTLRSRAGYMTDKPPAPNAKPPRLVETLESGLPGGSLELHATAAPLARGKDGITTLLTVDVTYAGLPADAPATDRVDLVWLAISPDAKIKRSGQNSIDVPIGASSSRVRMVALQDLIELPDRQLTLRVAVSSHASRMQGTVHLALDVPSLDEKPIDATPLVIGLDGLPPGPTVALGAAASATPFFPSTARTFHAGQRLRIFARVLGHGLETATTALTLKQGDQEIRTIPITTRPASTVADAIDGEAKLPIEDLPPGRYVLELLITQGKTVLRRATVIEIQ